MSSKRKNLIADIYFGLILTTGVLYSLFLGISFEKIFSGFVMQIIFFLDTLKYDNSVVELLFSKMFVVNTIPGLILAVLLGKYAGAAIKTLAALNTGNKFIKSLKIISNDKVIKFKSKRAEIFAYGIWRPKIYVSEMIYKNNNKSEIEAMVWHEVNHQQQFHPLKLFISNFIEDLFPKGLGMNWMVENFKAAIEIASDTLAEEKIKNKKPIVSALIKMEQQSVMAGANYFSAQRERIEILVGKKKQKVVLPMTYFSVAAILILGSSVMMSKTSFFYECPHLLRCFENLVNHTSTPLMETPVSISSHCQN